LGDTLPPASGGGGGEGKEEEEEVEYAWYLRRLGIDIGSLPSCDDDKAGAYAVPVASCAHSSAGYQDCRSRLDPIESFYQLGGVFGSAGRGV
jgi:hypothetical protein